MRTQFALNPVQEFELWLDGLMAHHQNDQVLPGLVKPSPGSRRLQEEVRTSLEIIRDLKQMAQNICDREREVPSAAGSHSLFLGEEIVDPAAQDSGTGAEATGVLIKFTDSLGRVEILLRSILRLPDVTPGEFEALGFLLESQVRSLRENAGFLHLRERYFNWQAYSEIEAMVAAAVTDPTCRKRLSRMFFESGHFMALIVYMRRGMSRGYRLPRILLLLTSAYLFLRNLLTLLEDTSRHLDAENPELAESLRGSRMTMQIEVGKVFKVELHNLDQENTIEGLHSRVERALGLMGNAVRGCMSFLAGLINPKLCPLAEEPSRFRDALKLLTDLHELQNILLKISDPLTPEDYQDIRRGIVRFRESSWKNLFASDRRPFDQLALEFEYCEPGSRTFVAHQVQVFLSTLIGQVQNRAVFSELKTEAISAQA
jgi:hypothetical protein